jgi:hypothetical protein
LATNHEDLSYGFNKVQKLTLTHSYMPKSCKIKTKVSEKSPILQTDFVEVERAQLLFNTNQGQQNIRAVVKKLRFLKEDSKTAGKVGTSRYTTYGIDDFINLTSSVQKSLSGDTSAIHASFLSWGFFRRRKVVSRLQANG